MAALALTFTAIAPVAQAADPEPVAAAGVTIGGVDVAGLTAAQATTAVTTAYTSGLVRVHVGKRVFKQPVKRLDVQVQGLAAAVTAALKLTAAGDVPVSITYDRPALIKAVASIDTATRTKARNAHWTWRGKRPVAIAEKAGTSIDRGALRVAITAELHKTAAREATAKVTKRRASISRSELPPAIAISRNDHRLHLYRFLHKKTVLWRRFGVAVGQAAYPTPRGLFRIVTKQRNPWWYPPDSPWAKGLKPIPPGPGNPLGTRWMGLNVSGVGIHGTPDAASIGYSASHGCIRMRIPDAEWLFNHVRVGSPVRIF
jgi:L,D-transpeptidase-like protein/putative peptidoglycan binding protein